MSNVVDKINNMLWGDLTIVLIFAAFIFLSFKCGFIQLKIKRIFKAFFSSDKDKKCSSSIAAVLAASMGTGNILGTAAALAAGGPGAVLWMNITAFFGMAAAYSENYLGIFSIKGKGKAAPFSYISQLPCGRFFSFVYGVLCICAAFTMGNMLQGSAACSAASELTGSGKITAALVISAVLAPVILGGAERISHTAEKLIPPVSVVYIALALGVVIINRENIPYAVGEIFSQGLGIKAAAGGAVGYTVRSAVSVGMRRGIFSNEAGLGSSAAVHSSSGITDPDRAGKWAACEVFIDTVICCTLTALAVLTSGADISADSAAVLSDTFGAAFGITGEFLLSVCVMIFAASSVLGWCCCGELSLKNIGGGKRGVYIYRIMQVILLFIGGAADISRLWGLADIVNYLMLMINMTAVIAVSCGTEFREHDIIHKVYTAVDKTDSRLLWKR